MSLKQAAKTAVKRRSRPAAIAALPAIAAVAVLLPATPPRLYWALIGGAVVALAAAAVASLRLATRRARVLAATSAPALISEVAVATGPIPDRKLRAFAKWHARLNHGWSATAMAAFQQTAKTRKEHPDYRLKVLGAMADHYASRRVERHPSRELELDLVIVSTMNLLGGTTSANEAEILAYRDGGLRIGFLHHPVLDRALERPVHPRLSELVDDERVFEIRPSDTVRCDLLIVRFPTAMAHLMDDLPQIDAKRTVLLVNQTPYEEYGLTGGYGTPWSVRDVHRNLSEWIGPHTWYAIGPAVRDTLRNHHADDIAGIDLAPDFWYETIDVAKWTPSSRRIREEGEPIRLGRHSRDHITKFPNMAARLRTAYPDAADVEVHVLGGEKSLIQLLGTIPPRWTSHPFGSVSPVDFLGELDVYAYFIDENYVEAFGRSPLEAIAAGVPCILPNSFAELFGDGAVYCAPEEVESEMRRLMDNPEYYAERVQAGMRIIDERFSPQALLRRVNGLGVTVDPTHLRPTATTNSRDSR